MAADREQTREQTLGDRRVRIDFNPSADPTVHEFNRRAGLLIDLCEKHKQRQEGEPVTSEEARLWALAQTAFEEGAMWAVKAATINT